MTADDLAEVRARVDALDTAALRADCDSADEASLYDAEPSGLCLTTADVRALCDVAEDVPRLLALVEAKQAEVKSLRERHAHAFAYAEMFEAERDAARADLARRDAALAAVTALCDEADEAHKAYLAGVILDRFIMPSNVTTERLRAAITDAMGEATT